jgi:hypothetical protein
MGKGWEGAFRMHPTWPQSLPATHHAAGHSSRTCHTATITGRFPTHTCPPSPSLACTNSLAVHEGPGNRAVAWARKGSFLRVRPLNPSHRSAANMRELGRLGRGGGGGWCGIGMGHSQAKVKVEAMLKGCAPLQGTVG